MAVEKTNSQNNPENSREITEGGKKGYSFEEAQKKLGHMMNKAEHDLEFEKRGGVDGIRTKMFESLRFQLAYIYPNEADAPSLKRAQESIAALEQDPKYIEQLNNLIRVGYSELTNTQRNGKNELLLFLYNFPLHS